MALRPTAHRGLCAACGLCCNGTFFSQITLRGHAEIARTKQRGLVVISKPERTIATLPCPQHSGSACQIYEDRPAVCAAYRCALLKRVDSGDVPLEDAERHVQRLRAVVSRIAQALSLSTRGQALFDAAMAFFEGVETVEARRRHGELLLDMAEFLKICRDDFGVGDKKKP